MIFHVISTGLLLYSKVFPNPPCRTQRAGLKEGTPCKELVYIFNGDICVSWAFLGLLCFFISGRFQTTYGVIWSSEILGGLPSGND